MKHDANTRSADRVVVEWFICVCVILLANRAGHGCPVSGHPFNHVDGRREATTETGEVTSADGTARSVRPIK